MKRIHLSLAGAVLIAAGCSSDSLNYQYSENGCDTGTHQFSSKDEYCSGLKNEALNNNGCARDLRKKEFQQQSCPGGFDGTPDDSGPGPVPTQPPVPTPTASSDPEPPPAPRYVRCDVDRKPGLGVEIDLNAEHPKLIQVNRQDSGGIVKIERTVLLSDAGVDYTGYAVFKSCIFKAYNSHAEYGLKYECAQEANGTVGVIRDSSDERTGRGIFHRGLGGNYALDLVLVKCVPSDVPPVEASIDTGLIAMPDVPSFGDDTTLTACLRAEMIRQAPALLGDAKITNVAGPFPHKDESDQVVPTVLNFFIDTDRIESFHPTLKSKAFVILLETPNSTEWSPYFNAATKERYRSAAVKPTSRIVGSLDDEEYYRTGDETLATLDLTPCASVLKGPLPH